LLVVCSCIFIS